MLVDGTSRGELFITFVVTCGSTVPYADLRRLYVRQDMRDTDTPLLAYFDLEVNFLIDQSREIYHVG